MNMANAAAAALTRGGIAAGAITVARRAVPTVRVVITNPAIAIVTEIAIASPASGLPSAWPTKGPPRAVRSRCQTLCLRPPPLQAASRLWSRGIAASRAAGGAGGAVAVVAAVGVGAGHPVVWADRNPEIQAVRAALATTHVRSKQTPVITAADPLRTHLPSRANRSPTSSPRGRRQRPVLRSRPDHSWSGHPARPTSPQGATVGLRNRAR
jgi:hypothetical protein